MVRREGLAPPKVDRPHGLQPCAFAAPPPTQFAHYSGYGRYFNTSPALNQFSTGRG